MHAQARFYYSSYAFNGGNFLGGTPPVQRYPGISGLKVSDIANPSRTILVLEFPALMPYSWHQPTGVVRANNVCGNASFVDGHASYPKFFWDEKHTITNTVESWHYDPPAGRATAMKRKAAPLLPSDYGKFHANVKARVRAAQIRAGLAANRELVVLLLGHRADDPGPLV